MAAFLIYWVFPVVPVLFNRVVWVFQAALERFGIMLTLSVFNHLIGQNPEVGAAFAGYNGIVLGIRAAGFQVCGRFDESGLLQAADRGADTVLVFHRSAWDKVLDGKMPDMGDFEIEGDVALGFNLLMLVGRLRYHAGQDMQKLFGEAAVGNIGQRMRKIGQVFQSLGRDLVEHGGRAGSDTVGRREFEDLSDEVSRLRADIDRLCAMLEKSGKPKHGRLTK